MRALLCGCVFQQVLRVVCFGYLSAMDRKTEKESDSAGMLLDGFQTHMYDRLVGLVVKASASRAGGPGFESR